MTIILREVIAFTPESQIGNLLAYLQDSSSEKFRNHLNQASVYLAQAKLCLGCAMRTEAGSRSENRRLLETLSVIGQASI